MHVIFDTGVLQSITFLRPVRLYSHTFGHVFMWVDGQTVFITMVYLVQLKCRMKILKILNKLNFRHMFNHGV